MNHLKQVLSQLLGLSHNSINQLVCYDKVSSLQAHQINIYHFLHLDKSVVHHLIEVIHIFMGFLIFVD